VAAAAASRQFRLSGIIAALAVAAASNSAVAVSLGKAIKRVFSGGGID